MWKVIRYVARTNGYGPPAAGLLLFGGALFVVAATPGRGGFPVLAGYLVIMSALLAAVLGATACRPEDTPTLESWAALPQPFWRMAAATVALHWATTLLIAALVSLAAAVVLGPVDAGLLWLTLAAVAAGSLFFAGLALFGTVLGRSSQFGLLLGLLVFAAPLAASFSEWLSPAIHPYVVAVGPEALAAWWTARLAYAALGVAACVGGLCWLQNTDRLLAGGRSGAPRSLSGSSSGGRRKGLRAVVARAAPRPASRLTGLLVYETALAVLGGIAPILVLTACIALGSITVGPDLLSGDRSSLAGQLASFPSASIYVLVLLLPFVLSDSVPADRRARLDQLLLAAISPQLYLWGKVLGTCAAVVLLALLGNLLLLLPAAALLPPAVLLMYGGLLLVGLVPMLVYVSAASVLLGALSGPRRPLFVSAAIAVGFFSLILATRSTVLGNVLFPSGIMATDTISNQVWEWLAAWLFQHEHVHYVYQSSPNELVVLPAWLLLPLLSVAIQVGLATRLVGRLFEREVTRQ